MTKEEEAILNIKIFIKSIRSDLTEESKDNQKLADDIETVLNMLKEKDEEIEKKDKIIDLMAEFIEKVTVDLKIAFGENMLWNRNEIKQYFEREAKSDK